MEFRLAQNHLYIIILHASVIIRGVSGRCPTLVKTFTGGQLHCIPERFGQHCQIECYTGYLKPPGLGGIGNDSFSCNTTTNKWIPDTTPHCIEINECESSPCLHGATCKDKIAKYTCTCPTGYTGVNCESEIYDCVTHACINNGTCQAVNATDYRCECVTSFQGVFCSYIDGLWNAWTMWSSCTSTCGFGEQKRRRQCVLLPDAPSVDKSTQPLCNGSSQDMRTCFTNTSCALLTSSAVVTSVTEEGTLGEHSTSITPLKFTNDVAVVTTTSTLKSTNNVASVTAASGVKSTDDLGVVTATSSTTLVDTETPVDATTVALGTVVALGAVICVIIIVVFCRWKEKMTKKKHQDKLPTPAVQYIRDPDRYHPGPEEEPIYDTIDDVNITVQQNDKTTMTTSHSCLKTSPTDVLTPVSLINMNIAERDNKENLRTEKGAQGYRDTYLAPADSFNLLNNHVSVHVNNSYEMQVWNHQNGFAPRLNYPQRNTYMAPRDYHVTEGADGGYETAITSAQVQKNYEALVQRHEAAPAYSKFQTNMMTVQQLGLTEPDYVTDERVGNEAAQNDAYDGYQDMEGRHRKRRNKPTSRVNTEYEEMHIISDDRLQDSH